MNEQGSPATIVAIADEILAAKRIPCATYRFQFNRDFTFRDAAALVDYLHELGISDCYASPLLRARPGSAHGYDICDHSQLNPELGTEEDFQNFTSTLSARSMGLLLDTVPNHMGIGDANLWWMDVLENGPSSTYATYFDVDWHPAKPELKNKVLLPLLEDQYGRVLESGRLRLNYEEGSFFFSYYKNRLPVAPRTYSEILGHTLQLLTGRLQVDDEHSQELQSILTALSYLPPRTELDPVKIAERLREKEVIKRRLTALYQACAEVSRAIDETVRIFNGQVGVPQSFDLLDELVDAQVYRASFWRVAADEINYRRFFDINELAAVCVENTGVFHAVHHLIFRLLEEGKVMGLRIDHPDGLWDPGSYFHQLQLRHLLQKVRARLTSEAACSESILTEWLSGRSKDVSSRPPRPLYVVVEKILSEEELLDQDWEIDGTTGYDFLNSLNGIFVDYENRTAFDKIYAQFIRQGIDYRNLVNATKKTIMLVSMASEIHVLSHRLDRVSEKNRRYRDFTLNSLTFALREVIAALPVYRTYITGPDTVTERDRNYIEGAIAEARRRNPRTAKALFDFVRDTLVLQNLPDFQEEDRPKIVEFVMKFQQLTGPVMAKGAEDTAFYVYNRLVSLNEVGGNPARFGCTVPEFHKHNVERGLRWPHSLLATSTHDTKRGEDVRARIDVLSEIPDEWRQAVNRWARLNARKKVLVESEPAPDRNDEYHLYQTLIGAWPEGWDPEGMPPAAEFDRFRERISAYMQKAIREAKVHTSWINPNEEYDAAVRRFVASVLDLGRRNRFLREFQPFQRRVAFYGRLNGLSQALIKLTTPGVPDLYQGTEFWDLSLVDPDNRRPVNYESRRRLLSELRNRMHVSGQRENRNSSLQGLTDELIASCGDGRIKFFVIYCTLRYRRDHASLFARGAYLPLSANGDEREHVCAYLRTLENQTVVVVTPRLIVRLTGGLEELPHGEDVWKDARLELPPGHSGLRYRNLFTGEVTSVMEKPGHAFLPLAEILRRFPVALLEPM